VIDPENNLTVPGKALKSVYDSARFSYIESLASGKRVERSSPAGRALKITQKRM